MNRRQLALLLAMTPGFGGRTVLRILTRMELLGEEPESLFQYSEVALQESFKLTKRQIGSLNAWNDPAEQLQPTQTKLEVLGIKWMTLIDAHYPSAIESFDPDPPGVLFTYGNERLLEGATFCVLSSRNPTPAALEMVEGLTEAAVLKGEILVSGHDTPVYQRSAVVPLRWGAPRILCLDRGFFEVLGQDLTEEPFRAARLWRYQFDPSTDLVVSPFRPHAGFKGINNQVRDRLIASLSRRLDFVEISEGGNMEKLAAMAFQCGRAVRISDRSLNYRQLAESGAQLIRERDRTSWNPSG